MHLFEVIHWGNDSDDPFTGGPNGPDTCFLVRAGTPDEAGRLADALLQAPATASAIYLLGTDASDDADARVLRGPYVQKAYRFGWRHWYRDSPGAAWVEKTDA